jgi:hypothetical protein
MDELERLVGLYRTRKASSARSKLDVLIDLERVRDSRVVPFLLMVLADRDEREEVRIHIVRQLRTDTGVLVPSDRPVVSEALRDVLTDTSAAGLQLQAALALGDFVECEGVLSSLTALSLAQNASIDLRYAAFTSIERAGPGAQGIAVMRQIAADDALGNAARSVLSAWHTA